MFFVFSKDIKSEHIEEVAASQKKKKARPTWSDREERCLNDLKQKRGDAYDQTIWIHNQITYFSYELSKATDEYKKAKDADSLSYWEYQMEENTHILSRWKEKMEYERLIMRRALDEMQPLLEKKQLFEEYDEDEEHED